MVPREGGSLAGFHQGGLAKGGRKLKQGSNEGQAAISKALGSRSFTDSELQSLLLLGRGMGGTH